MKPAHPTESPGRPAHAVAPGTAAPRPGDSYVQSFARGLEVIRSFNAAAPQQTLSDVAARTGLTRAGARRILLTLQTLGYVHSDGKLFRLTPRILDLGFAYLSSMPIWNLAEPVMEDLSTQVQESSSIAVLEGTDVVYVQRVATHKIMSVSLVPGSRLAHLYPGQRRVTVNSIHHQGIKRLAPGFVVEAVSHPDGIPEAIRRSPLRGQGYIAATQWHPEFHVQGSHTLDDTALLHDFLGACSAARFRPFPAVSPLHIRDRAARLLRQAARCVYGRKHHRALDG